MVTSTVECGRCGRPVPDQAAVCAICSKVLERLLGEVVEPRASHRREPARRGADARRVKLPSGYVSVDERGTLAPGAFGSTASSPWDSPPRRLQDELEVSRVRQARRRSPYEGGSGGSVGSNVVPPTPLPLHRMAEPPEAPRLAPEEIRPVQRRADGPRRPPRQVGDDPGVLLEAWQAGRPWDERAAEVLTELTTKLRGWVLWVAEIRGTVHPAADDPATSASWLLQQGAWLRHRDETPAAILDLEDVLRRARRLVDVPADRWFAGPCTTVVTEPGDLVEDRDTRLRRQRVGRVMGDGPGEARRCGTDLYAVPGRPSVECPACGTAYQVEDRREWLLTAAQDVVEDGPTIARALTSMGLALTNDAIRTWRQRELLDDYGVDARGRRLYRLGDVQELFLTSLARTGRPTTSGRA